MQQVPGGRGLDRHRGRSHHQAGATQRKGPGHLGKVAVETDDETDPAQTGVVERGEDVPRGEDRRLARRRVEMSLSVPGHQFAAGVEHQCRVMQPAVVIELGNAARRQVHGVGASGVGQLLGSRPAQRFGVALARRRPRLSGS